MLERLSVRHDQVAIREILSWRDNDELCLDPPYQRGDVWGMKRRVNLIRSLIIGVPIPSIVVNDRFAAKWNKANWKNAVIDGKQRCTTILMFFDNQFTIPGEWFGKEWTNLYFENFNPVERRVFKNKSIGMCVCTLPNLKKEQEVFELINFGGVPQGESDE